MGVQRAQKKAMLELDLARVLRAEAEHAGGNHQKARSYAASLLDSPSA